MHGRANGTFDPDGNLTLAEAIKMAAVVHHIYNGGDGIFVQGSPWYQVYVDYAISNRIISSSSFDSEYQRFATRREMATIFARSVPSDELREINSVVYLPDVIDAREITGGHLLYGDDIFMLYRAGVLTGNDNLGTFKPYDDITRAEAAAIICRLVVPVQRRVLNLSQVIISGDFATDELINSFESYESYDDLSDTHYGDGAQRIFITTNIAVKDFSYIHVGFDNDGRVRPIEVLFTLDELLPDKPFVVNWTEVGSLPQRGFSFVDENGVTRYFTISQSGYDGALIISEFSNN
jgi:hypothetical protein